jgi:hypothetical protein
MPAQVAVQIVGEVEEPVVHREHEVGDEAGDRERPAVELHAVTAMICSAVHPPFRRCQCHIVLKRAAPQKPPSAAGSCLNRTSSGTSPLPRTIDLDNDPGEVIGNSVAFSPDRRVLATSGLDLLLHLPGAALRPGLRGLSTT